MTTIIVVVVVGILAVCVVVVAVLVVVVVLGKRRGTTGNFVHLLLARRISQYCFARWRLLFIVVCKARSTLASMSKCCRFGQHCRSNVRLCRKDEISKQNSFDIVAVFDNSFERCFDIVAKNGNNVEATL